jgi:hypothetical protein
MHTEGEKNKHFDCGRIIPFLVMEMLVTEEGKGSVFNKYFIGVCQLYKPMGRVAILHYRIPI